MTELRHVVWDWEPVIARLRREDPLSGYLLQLAARPIAADRKGDGKLLLVLGCWIEQALDLFADDSRREAIAWRLNALLDDRVELLIVRWPGRMLGRDHEDVASLERTLAAMKDGAPADSVLQETVYANPPNPLDDLGIADPDVREQGTKCEGALDRLLYARVVGRGLRPACQHVVLNYRLDVALVERRIAADVLGWKPTAGRRAHESREREESLADAGWGYVSFAGSQILEDVERCVERFLQLRPTEGPPPPSGGPLSLGSYRRSLSDRRPRRR